MLNNLAITKLIFFIDLILLFSALLLITFVGKAAKHHTPLNISQEYDTVYTKCINLNEIRIYDVK